MARKAYSAQLDISIESLQPRLDRTVYLSADPDLGWNELAVPFYLSEGNGTNGAHGSNGNDEGRELEHALLPGRTVQRTYRLNYLFILESVCSQNLKSLLLGTF